MVLRIVFNINAPSLRVGMDGQFIKNDCLLLIVIELLFAISSNIHVLCGMSYIAEQLSGYHSPLCIHVINCVARVLARIENLPVQKI